MRIYIQNAIKYFTKTPRTLFLIDSIGAALTIFFLFFVLTHFYDYVGMPTYILKFLSVIGLAFCIYSTTCFFSLTNSWAPFLRALSVANAMYCVLTIVLLCIFFSDLTILGLSYFLIEITIIVVLLYIELRVATALAGN